MNLQGTVIVTVFAFLGVVFAEELEDTFMKEAVNILDECENKEITLCLKERALKYVEELPAVLDFGSGLRVSPTPSSDGKRSARYITLPEEPRAREEAIDGALMERFLNYLSSHTFQFKVPEDALVDLKRSIDEDEQVEEFEEGRKKKKKGGMNMMMLLQLKAAAIGAILLKVIGLVAFKALAMAKIALIISVMIALKKLLDAKHHSSSYEVITAHDDHAHGHYDRSFKSNELPYMAYSHYRK